MKAYIKEEILSDNSTVWNVCIFDGEKETLIPAYSMSNAILVVNAIDENCLVD